MSVIRRIKTRSGYYEWRRRKRRPRFERALRPTDTFIVGHPKSGNTWLAYMLAILLFPDRRDSVNLVNVGDFVPFVHAHDYRIRRYPDLPDPRVFRNEVPEHPDLYPRTIYLLRDPRAVLVSFWHMYRTMFAEDLGFDPFLDQYLATSGIFEWWNAKLTPWDRQVDDALSRAETDASLTIVRYEEMVADRQAALRRLAAFLELPADPEALAAAVERGGFRSMRLDEEAHGAEAYEGRAAGEGRFVRKGRTDGWRDEIGSEQAARIEDAFGEVMARAGYE